MLITSCKIGEVHFRLLGTNGFQVNANNGRFAAAGSRCRQNVKFENFMSLFCRLRQKIAAKSVPYVQHDYISLFKQLKSQLGSLSKDDGNGTDNAREQ